MDNFLLLVMATSGLCVVSSHVGRRYHFVYERKNMTEAQSYCREKYTDLATIYNMEDMKILNDTANLSKMVYPSDSYRAWIGLYDDLDSWRWSLSDTSFYKHGEAEFRGWYPAEPNNYGGGEHCTLMYSDGQWADYPCDDNFKAVCFDVRGSNVTFVLTNNPMTWTEAQSYCREHHTDLASVRNTAENQKVKELVPAGQNVWIGLFRDSWKWSDGSNCSFRYWRQNEPNGRMENCAAANFDQSGRWEDWSCDWKRAFICYNESAVAASSEFDPTADPHPKESKDASDVVPTVSKQVVKVRVKKSSSVDLNDAAVMEDMLMQIKQKLKDQGVTGDVKLSWRKQSDGKVFHKEKKKTKKRSACQKKDEL